MADTPEILLLKADVHPVRGREVFWALSKNQIEHIVLDARVNRVPFSQNHLDGIAAWHGLALPVVSLERYYRFKRLSGRKPKQRVLVKTISPHGGGEVARLLVNAAYEIAIRPLDQQCSAAGISRQELEKRNLKGVYEWGEDKLLLVPDIAKIAFGDDA